MHVQIFVEVDCTLCETPVWLEGTEELARIDATQYDLRFDSV